MGRGNDVDSGPSSASPLPVAAAREIRKTAGRKRKKTRSAVPCACPGARCWRAGYRYIHTHIAYRTQATAERSRRTVKLNEMNRSGSVHIQRIYLSYTRSRSRTHICTRPHAARQGRANKGPLHTCALDTSESGAAESHQQQSDGSARRVHNGQRRMTTRSNKYVDYHLCTSTE